MKKVVTMKKIPGQKKLVKFTEVILGEIKVRNSVNCKSSKPVYTSSIPKSPRVSSIYFKKFK